MSQEAQKSFQEAHRKLQKKFRAEILTIFSLLIWYKRWQQKVISKFNWPLGYKSSGVLQKWEKPEVANYFYVA